MLDNKSRIRHFNMVLYSTEDELLKMFVKYKERITRYAYIVHDKCVYDRDIYEEDGKTLKHKQGEAEKVHIHLLLSVYNNTTCSAIKKLFSTDTDKPRVEPMNDIYGSFRYLIHKDNPEKYQYDLLSVQSNDMNYYLSLETNGERKESDQKAWEIVQLLRQDTSPMIIAKRYGRDFIIHYRQYKDFCDSVTLWERENRYRLIEVPNEKDPFEKKEYDQEKIPFEDDQKGV